MKALRQVYERVSPILASNPRTRWPASATKVRIAIFFVGSDSDAKESMLGTVETTSIEDGTQSCQKHPL
jgi:hypothetical protein